MKNYMKPTLVFAAASTGTTGTCDYVLTQDDLDLIGDIVGKDNIDQAFGMNEGCTIPFDMYCKYTSAESGVKAFTS
jgi:hypothetical protein